MARRPSRARILLTASATTTADARAQKCRCLAKAVAGDRTGHAHELAGHVYEVGARRGVLLERPEVLTHQEHRHIEVPASWWEVRTQREYVPIQRRSRRRYD